MKLTAGEIVAFGLILLSLVACSDPEDIEKKVPYPQEHISWPSLADTPWPMEGHDPQGTNRSQHAGTLIGELAFTYNDTFYAESSLSLDAENNIHRLYTRSSVAYQLKVDNNNQTLWRTALGRLIEAHWTMIHTSSNTGIIPIYNSEKVEFIDLIDGESILSVEFDDKVGAPVIDMDGNTYFVVYNPYTLISISSTGDLRWSLDNLGEIGNYARFAPDGGTLYLRSRDSLVAVSTSGNKLWAYPLVGYCWDFLIDNEGHIYFSEDRSRVTCVTPEGQLRWSVQVDSLGIGRVGLEGPTMDTKGNFYISARDSSSQRGVLSFDNEGNIRWFRVIEINSAIVSDQNDNLFFGSNRNSTCLLSSINSEGEINWQLDYGFSPGALVDPVIGSNGYIYYPIKDGSGADMIVVR
jgi:hypothetical protein